MGPIASPLFCNRGRTLTTTGDRILAVADFGPGAGFSTLLGVAVAPSPVITKVANAEGESLTIRAKYVG